jgi:hypothetical protein
MRPEHYRCLGYLGRPLFRVPFSCGKKIQQEISTKTAHYPPLSPYSISRVVTSNVAPPARSSCRRFSCQEAREKRKNKRSIYGFRVEGFDLISPPRSYPRAAKTTCDSSFNFPRIHSLCSLQKLEKLRLNYFRPFLLKTGSPTITIPSRLPHALN